MYFKYFAKIYNDLLNMTTTNEINMYITKNVNPKHRKEVFLWLYIMFGFEKKFKINDKHLLTVFCKIQEPHIDRKNLQEAFKNFGVAQTCSTVVKFDPTKPITNIQMVTVYNFLLKLQNVPSKNFYLLKLFKSIVELCDQTTLYCLIDFIRGSNKNKKLNAKRRNLYLFKQVFDRKTFDQLDAYKQELQNSGLTILKMNDLLQPGKPIEPMLALPWKNVSKITFKEICAEIKYNGERVQLHKFHDKITCYKRNLNVHTKCTNVLLNVIQRVLRHVENVILDCEFVGNSVDTYGLIVFDVLYYNNKNYLNVKLKNRKQILEYIMYNKEPCMTQIYYELFDNVHTLKSWVHQILNIHQHHQVDINNNNNNEDKENNNIINEIEGVVIKNWNENYEPKRKKWLKIKKSYFNNVCTADLVVVGGWKKNKGNITIYLVATPFFDHDNCKTMFLPVSKVKYSKNNYEHLMTPYTGSASCDWLVVDKRMNKLRKIPNMVAIDPLKMPVWEMTGDFIRSSDSWTWGNITHNYVSIRLPRFIRVRDDKTYQQANTFMDLVLLSSISNESFNYPDLYEFLLPKNCIKNYIPNKN
uniref:DNA ligase n=1 Tax=Cnaphalocrocis medinalis granulovirus TaxID=1750712 RepID=A0A0X9HJ48_9BBAC|nr:DNA ligase [Cnaphalocrocis medinalis granulovirus]